MAADCQSIIAAGQEPDAVARAKDYLIAHMSRGYRLPGTGTPCRTERLAPDPRLPQGDRPHAACLAGRSPGTSGARIAQGRGEPQPYRRPMRFLRSGPYDALVQSAAWRNARAVQNFPRLAASTQIPSIPAAFASLDTAIRANPAMSDAACVSEVNNDESCSRIQTRCHRHPAHRGRRRGDRPPVGNAGREQRAVTARSRADERQRLRRRIADHRHRIVARSGAVVLPDGHSARRQCSPCTDGRVTVASYGTNPQGLARAASLS